MYSRKRTCGRSKSAARKVDRRRGGVRRRTRMIDVFFVFKSTCVERRRGVMRINYYLLYARLPVRPSCARTIYLPRVQRWYVGSTYWIYGSWPPSDRYRTGYWVYTILSRHRSPIDIRPSDKHVERTTADGIP